MVIVANYADLRESYGLLGPQLAATIIQEHTPHHPSCLRPGYLDKGVGEAGAN